MDGDRHRQLVQAGHQELERHDLREGVLQGDPVGIEVRVAAPAFKLLPLRVSQMVQECLLGECQWPPEAHPSEGRRLAPPRIDGFDERRRGR